MPDAVLRIGGQAHGGWTSIRVSTSLGQAAGGFGLGFSERHPGAPARQTVKAGAPCTVALDGVTVITGYVDGIEPSYDKESHTLTASGRDKTGDLVDCCHVGARTQWKGQDLAAIAQELCDPFGIEVNSLVDLPAPFENVSYGPGDTVLATITKLCRQREVLPISLGDGRLTLARAGQARAAGALELGKNIKAGRLSVNHAERHSQYQVKGHGKAGAATLSFADAPKAKEKAAQFNKLCSPAGLVLDPVIKRHRPLVVLAEAAGDQAAFEARARWEAASRAGKSRKASYTVKGWGPAPGALWRINQLVRVTDEFLGLAEDLLIESADYSLDEQGSITTLGLVHPDAYAARPVAAKNIKTVLDFSG